MIQNSNLRRSLPLADQLMRISNSHLRIKKSHVLSEMKKENKMTNKINKTSKNEAGIGDKMKNFKVVFISMCLSFINILSAQPTVYDLWNGVENHTNGGIGTGLYIDGTNRVIIRSNFAFQRTTFSLQIPVDHTFSGSGSIFPIPPSVFFGYRVMDYKSDLAQIFTGFSTVAMGSYNFDLHLMLRPSKNVIMLATIGAVNEVVDRIESDSLTIYQITSNPVFAFSTELQGWNVLQNWSLSLLVGNRHNSDFPINALEAWLDRSYLSLERQYDENLRFEFRIGYYQRQFIINYLFSK
ncbi:MAG: hypothetical protein H8D45_15910 [Bacteroidetes bacterium]|nr:hypothetical protein [Bacteroidota bacterium]